MDNKDYKNAPDPTLYKLISQVVSDLLNKQNLNTIDINNKINNVSYESNILLPPSLSSQVMPVIDSVEPKKLVLTTDMQLPSNLNVEVDSGNLFISEDGNLTASVNIKIDDIIDIVDYEVKYVAI